MVAVASERVKDNLSLQQNPVCTHVRVEVHLFVRVHSHQYGSSVRLYGVESKYWESRKLSEYRLVKSLMHSAELLAH